MITELRERIAYAYLVPRPFYVLPPANNGDAGVIPVINRRERIARWIVTGTMLPEKPKVMYLGSGASAKGYIAVGLAKKFHENGIKFDGHTVCSIQALLGVGVHTGDYKLLEKFALDVPEMLKEKPLPVVLNLADKITHQYFHDGIVTISRLIQLLKAEKIELPDGSFKLTNNGIVQTTVLESELKKHLGDIPISHLKDFYITAMDYTNQRLVFLGKDYSDMMAYRAFMAGIALPKLLAFVVHQGNVLGDSGNVMSFPLIEGVFDKRLGTTSTVIGPEYTTIVAVDLGYQANYKNSDPSGGLGGIVKADEIESSVRNRLLTELLTDRIAGMSPPELAKFRDRKYMRTLLLTPETTDIPPAKIDIPMPRRKELIEQGEELGELVTSEFRRVA